MVKPSSGKRPLARAMGSASAAGVLLMMNRRFSSLRYMNRKLSRELPDDDELDQEAPGRPTVVERTVG
ncbi:hypothetical protein UA74_27930 [Actinoalloteichus fjordicus]|uniref:Uncharacterized protein n=1 Tax=Actinoalloteichus fjordicus TaxID=1612552 RepID=A0AAC9PUX6_9PSEU|nr:hypothetical protein UA74_27930 [Actinoalloteichus fjordicus]